MQLFTQGYIDRAEGKKVCGIDLDDCLADSIPAWIQFVNTFDYKSKEFENIVGKDFIKNNAYIKWIGSYHHLRFMKKTVPYYYYRILKELYRQSDIKRKLPLMPAACTFMQFLRNEGYFIIVLTRREERSLKVTTDWLAWHGLPYDGIIFDKNKHIRILESFPQMEFMVEDHRAIANLIGEWGYRVYLIDNLYNEGEVNRNVIRIIQPKVFEKIIKKIKGEELLTDVVEERR